MAPTADSRRARPSQRLASYLAALLFAVLPPMAARAASVGSIPDPRPGSQVIDLQGVLGVAGLQAVDEIAARGRTRGELLVVVADTTGGQQPRAFATALFNRLGLDDRQRNRGVLLFAAIADRKAEIVVGDGFPAGVSQTTDRIMRDQVIANFKRGDPRAAMVEGSRAIVDSLLLAADAPAASELPAGEVPVASPLHEVPRHPVPLRQFGEPQEPQEDFATRNPAVVWGGGGLGLFGVFLGVRRGLRLRARVCRRCGQKMVRLDDAADDAHLNAAERTEERVGSVDYDIWMCGNCQLTLKLRYGAFFTSYSKCGSCGAKTLKTTTTTLVSATQYSTGTARVDERCEHCGRHSSYTRTIPRKPKPSSSHSSFSGGSRSSSSSRGSSSGRGSSGSW